MGVLSLLLSSSQAFQFTINYFQVDQDYPMLTQESEFLYSAPFFLDPNTLMYHVTSLSTNDILYAVIQSLYDLFNYVFFTIFNFAIEVMIMRKLRQEIKEKCERFGHNADNSNAIKAETKTTIMDELHCFLPKWVYRLSGRRNIKHK